MDNTLLSKRKNEPLNTVMPSELKAVVLAYAAENNMSAGAVVRLALAKFFQRELAKKASTELKNEANP